MSRIEKLYRGTLSAWGMLIDFPLPEYFRRQLGRGADSLSTACGFPLVGVAVGILLAIAAGFCSVVFNPVGGGIVFALLAAAFLEFKDSGRGAALLGSFLLLRQRGVPAAEALPRLNSDLVGLNNVMAGLFLGILEALKLSFLFLLCFFQAKLWIVAVLSGAFFVQAFLAMQPSADGAPPLLPVAPENRMRLWRFWLVLYVLLMLAFPVGMIGAAAVVYFCATGLARYFEKNCGGVTSDLITLSGAVTELLLLLVGILLALHLPA